MATKKQKQIIVHTTSSTEVFVGDDYNVYPDAGGSLAIQLTHLERRPASEDVPFEHDRTVIDEQHLFNLHIWSKCEMRYVDVEVEEPQAVDHHPV